MKKIYKVQIGKDELRIPLGEMDSVQLCVDYGNDGENPQISIGGYNAMKDSRPSEQKIWLSRDLKLGEAFEFQYTESEEFTPPEQETKAGPYEERCSFCGKEKSNVDVLLEGGEYLKIHICNTCVTECSKRIIEERSNRS